MIYIKLCNFCRCLWKSFGNIKYLWSINFCQYLKISSFFCCLNKSRISIKFINFNSQIKKITSLITKNKKLTKYIKKKTPFKVRFGWLASATASRPVTISGRARQRKKNTCDLTYRNVNTDFNRAKKEPHISEACARRLLRIGGERRELRTAKAANSQL